MQKSLAQFLSFLEADCEEDLECLRISVLALDHGQGEGKKPMASEEKGKRKASLGM
jgi:hypothetical protein